MSTRHFNVLFVCTANSGRSILAEAILNAVGGDRFRAFSAGSHPTGTVHPLTYQTLLRLGIPTDGLRSKGWDEFTQPQAPRMGFIFTVCDRAAGESCPVWPGQPTTAHGACPIRPRRPERRRRRRRRSMTPRSRFVAGST